MNKSKKFVGILGLTALLAAFGGAAQAQSPMACELAGALAGSGAKKVYAAKANLRCTAEANAIQIDEISADAKLVDSPQSATRVTMNWSYVYRRKPSMGAVSYDVYAGETLLKSCPTGILDKDFSDTSSAGDSAECDLPADAYPRIDRVVFRIKGAHR